MTAPPLPLWERGPGGEGTLPRPHARALLLLAYEALVGARTVEVSLETPVAPAARHALADRVGLVLDPMLATGGSARAAITILKQWGVPRTTFMGLIAAPEGIAAVTAAHPEVPIHVAAVDVHLNEHGFIVPSLGDAGDGQFFIGA